MTEAVVSEHGNYVSLGGGTDVNGNDSGRVFLSSEPKVQTNRNIPTVAAAHPGDGATNVCTWTPTEDIHSIIIPPYMRYTINAVSDAAAKVTLDDAGGAAVDVAYGRTHSDSLIYSQRTAITQLDLRSFMPTNDADWLPILGQTEVTIEAWS